MRIVSDFFYGTLSNSVVVGSAARTAISFTRDTYEYVPYVGKKRTGAQFVSTGFNGNADCVCYYSLDSESSALDYGRSLSYVVWIFPCDGYHCCGFFSTCFDAILRGGLVVL